LLLDTTFLIDAERGGNEIDEVIEDDDDVAIAAISVAEMKIGVELAKGKTRANRQGFLDDVLTAVPVVDYDLDVADAHAQLLVAVRRQGRPRGAHGLVIAATALASSREVVSADASAFANLPGITVRRHREGPEARARKRDGNPTHRMG
jgi:tRNA(fMet)-specific endonuclease VapC